MTILENTLTEDDMGSRPNCPKCGEPARVAILTKARIRCELNQDGSVGYLISADRGTGTITGFECSGRHYWESK